MRSYFFISALALLLATPAHAQVRLSVMEPGKISYYCTSPDTLILLGSETPLERRVYARATTIKGKGSCVSRRGI